MKRRGEKERNVYEVQGDVIARSKRRLDVLGASGGARKTTARSDRARNRFFVTLGDKPIDASRVFPVLGSRQMWRPSRLHSGQKVKRLVRRGEGSTRGSSFLPSTIHLPFRRCLSLASLFLELCPPLSERRPCLLVPHPSFPSERRRSLPEALRLRPTSDLVNRPLPTLSYPRNTRVSLNALPARLSLWPGCLQLSQRHPLLSLSRLESTRQTKARLYRRNCTSTDR
jgi:hypothetical protein